MVATFNSYDNVIDSRDVIARIEELEALQEEDIISPDEAKELESLRTLNSNGEQYAEDWEYGTTLVNAEYFTSYISDFVQETYYEIKSIPDFLRNAIDWHKVAEELMTDYTEIDFDGATFYAYARSV